MKWAQEGAIRVADGVTSVLLNEPGVIGKVEVMVLGCRGVYDGKHEMKMEDLQVEALVLHKQGEYMGEASRTKESQNNQQNTPHAIGTRAKEEAQTPLQWTPKGGMNKWTKFGIRDPRDELVLTVSLSVDDGAGAVLKSTRSPSKKKAKKKELAVLRMNMLHLQERVAERLAKSLMGTQPGECSRCDRIVKHVCVGSPQHQHCASYGACTVTHFPTQSSFFSSRRWGSESMK
jgi:hypothetical protein